MENASLRDASTHSNSAKNSNFPPCKIKFEPIFFRNALSSERSPSSAVFFANFERKIKSLMGSSQLLPLSLISLILSPKSSFSLIRLSYKLSNLNLINKIVGLNYQLRRTNLDLDNLYKSYWGVIFKIDSIQDKQQREIDLQKYHETIFQTLKQIKNNYEPLMNNLVDVLANVKVAANVRFHSLFGYLNLLLMDIFPKMSYEAIEKEKERLKKQIAERTIKHN
ncbi:hypothetical protein A3H09_00455 [Candidatus Falkowbacteria bacterium RIFCSPLOWO2_12_FULL_45_13]|uniref:Uncharacterized protein n=2 Tax=Candidatus Falkowiibacteriota TaxID=1752728 RepID=A0A1F5SVK6_9BACT|nr:MAG: hypothetical protein A3H09_00455 [Candidatus Falkowbacteria bacterium RIFCSPLOWO2_12_FULL_45_13]